MPRPGPRPYECVRRAWHSDRHHPMRGSIIQQILRVVHETHSAATKKNKEWQEKLPTVVFKAEEIMYSKANSEADYMNLETLWDRVNDAVNTIIRRDESSETGELLPPCVEAALNLGCVPMRASRSQRHNNPRSYLSPRGQESVSVPPRVLDKASHERCPQIVPFQSGNQLNFARATTPVNSTFPVSESNHHMTDNSNVATPHGYPYLYENIAPGSNQLMTKETNMQLNLGSVYPLYYGDSYRVEESQLVSQVPQKMNTDTMFVGKPIDALIAEPAKMGVLQDFFTGSSGEIISKRLIKADFGNTHEKPPGTHCDLALRLCLFSDPCTSMQRSLDQETVSVGSSQVRGKFCDISPVNNELCSFPSRTNDPFQSCSSKLFLQGEDQKVEPTIRTPKAPFSDNVEDGQFCWRHEFPSNQFIGRIEGPGL